MRATVVLLAALFGFVPGGAASARCVTPELRMIDRPALEWGGRYERWGDHRPVIVLNVAPDHNAHGLDWTLRHELGHAQADRLGLAPSERYADNVADGRIPLTCPTSATMRSYTRAPTRA